MNKKKLLTVIILGIIALFGVLGMQFYWVNNALKIQKTDLKKQAMQDSLNRNDFNERVKIALTNTTNEILTLKNDPAEIYKAVEQIRPNYFIVRINDEVNPYLLKRILNEQFDKYHIDEDYRYGIYDCFSDSIVYSDLVSQKDSTVESSLVEAPQIKWEEDGHYFSVTFPNRPAMFIPEVKSNFYIWIILFIITALFISFIGYTIWVILQQKKISEIKTDFINNMTHELKTPISTISLSSEVLLRDDITENPERISRYAQIIFDENNRLKNQVDRVLQLAKLDKGEIKLKKSEFDLHEIIDSACAHFKLQLEQKNGTIECNNLATSSMINADKVHITNIIYNLLDNANKYTPNKPQILISTQNEKEGISISIKDNGVGMSRDAIKQIFDKFYRVPTGNVHNVKGFGLGLFYVNELIERHNGKITVKSKLTEGSTFKIWLPKN